MSEGAVTANDVEKSKSDERKRQRHAKLLGLLRRAWKFDEDELAEAAADALLRPWRARYLRLAKAAKWLSYTAAFHHFMTLTIFGAAALVGLQCELAVPGTRQTDIPILNLLDDLVVSIFAFEIMVKVCAEGLTPWHYFHETWNRFDFFVVFAVAFFYLPFMPSGGSTVAMLRLLRLLRVLKLIHALPELQVIVEALINGFGSITFVTVILFIFFYVYAIIGLLLFARADPEHWGTLQLALVSLFRIAGFDGWYPFLSRAAAR
jgi:voltage-gated sodium channel